MIIEEWKDIPGYEDIYQVSSFGNVRRNSKINLLKFDDSKDYLSVTLFKKGVRRKFYVHQLVMMAFEGYKPNRVSSVIDHKDKNKSNNRLDNLRIITQRENIVHSVNSNFVGVEIIKGKFSHKFRAAILIGKERVKFSTTKTIEESKEIYDLALKNINEFKGDVKKFKQLIYERKTLVV